MINYIDVIFRNIIDHDETIAIFPYIITDRRGGMLTLKIEPFEKEYVSVSYPYFQNNTDVCSKEKIDLGIQRLKEMGYREFIIIDNIDIDKYDKVCEKLMIYDARIS